MGFRCLVRDQEVDGSNPFAPTNLLESATYKMRKSIERLVQGQEVNAPGALAWSILSPLKSARYAAFSTTTSSLFLRTMRTTSLVLLGVRSPAQRFQGDCARARFIGGYTLHCRNSPCQHWRPFGRLSLAKIVSILDHLSA